MDRETISEIIDTVIDIAKQKNFSDSELSRLVEILTISEFTLYDKYGIKIG